MKGLAVGPCTPKKLTPTKKKVSLRHRRVAMLAVLAATALPGSAAWAGKAHEHGVARLEIGVEAGRITLHLELALEDLTGFERAPRTDAERAAVVAALARLQDIDKLVRIDGAAGCGPGKVQLTAPVWGVHPGAATASSTSSPSSAKDGTASRDTHADLEAVVEFRCSSAARAGHAELGLFDAFVRLKRIEVQAVSPRGQMKVVLRRPQARIGLAP